MTDDLEATASDLDAGYAVQGVGHLVQAFAFACGAMYFRKVGRWLANPRAQPT